MFRVYSKDSYLVVKSVDVCRWSTVLISALFILWFFHVFLRDFAFSLSKGGLSPLVHLNWRLLCSASLSHVIGIGYVTHIYEDTYIYVNMKFAYMYICVDIHQYPISFMYTSGGVAYRSPLWLSIRPWKSYSQSGADLWFVLCYVIKQLAIANLDSPIYKTYVSNIIY